MYCKGRLDDAHLVWPKRVAMRAVQRGSVILTRWVREAVTWGESIGSWAFILSFGNSVIVSRVVGNW